MSCLTRSGVSLRFQQCCTVAIIIIWSLSPASGKNFQVLIRILYAAFLVEDASAICASANIPLSDDDKNAFQAAKIYSLGIKHKVVAGLGDTDAGFVVKSAADLARAATKAEIDALAVYPPERISTEMLQWCIIR
jgi:hypothetical protein